MHENYYKLQIITPDRSFYDEEVERVLFKTTEGDMAVLKNHISLTTPLESGMAKIYQDDRELLAVLHGGFAVIQKDGVTILSDAAEWAEEIDVERAKKAKEKVEALLKEENHEAEQKLMKAALMRAMARIEVAEYHNNNK